VAGRFTGVRADAQVVWVIPHPPSELIPLNAHVLRIGVLGASSLNRPRQKPLSITSRKKIESIAALINALPLAPRLPTLCRADSGLRLAFYDRRTVRPVAVAELDPEGCGVVRLTINGSRQPLLEDPTMSSLVGQVSEMVGSQAQHGRR
jgi:hypothetical protein